mgnify:CR=1 FL=1
MKNLIIKVEEWAEEKGIFDKSDAKSQTLKFCSEAGEVADAVAKDDLDELRLEIGDVIVTLILLSRMKGLTIDDCLQGAYDKISKRKGSMINGVFVKDEG